ncbi:hypothetical protein [Chitinophaga sancti]|uniref:SEC-C motif-containing protein n=1 Tax=Chitinophaga sancti TaxID=1004 RepID=A0A1K1MUH6_9BACT|nr:hypothetical protein [Chitinophaga sancti]WQD62991.1 hypothetical protein U0033_01190 [Chitinophaga sancti]WQG91384.1 hypothetical protein SR876_07725 [Chitinophaga sancti]SFW26645.1 hypothetical protein SAMN05661012_00892 [Chitinophaga sancti]
MTSPIEITAAVQMLIDRVGSEYEYEIVPVQPGIATNGGRMISGWTVWLSEFICEAEPTEVWENEEGDLIAVNTPHVSVEKILFIPDDTINLEAKHIRVSVSNNPLVDHLIALADLKDFLLPYGTELEDGKVNFNTYTGNVYNHYDALFNNLLLFLSEGKKIGAKCYCGSMKPYSQCHGKNLPAAIEEDKKAVKKFNDALKEEEVVVQE